MQRGMTSPEIRRHVDVFEVHAKVSEAGDHALAPLNHLFNRGFTHRADAKHLPFQMVLSPDDLGIVLLLERRPPRIIDAFGVEDGGDRIAALTAVSEQCEACLLYTSPSPRDEL